LFFGESMFSRRPNASKAALIALCQFLPHIGIELVDCQVPNDHLMSMGAKTMSRDLFLNTLESALDKNTNAGNWEREFAQCNYAGINKSIE